jgi:hypothetical protein
VLSSCPVPHSQSVLKPGRLLPNFCFVTPDTRHSRMSTFVKIPAHWVGVLVVWSRAHPAPSVQEYVSPVLFFMPTFPATCHMHIPVVIGTAAEAGGCGGGDLWEEPGVAAGLAGFSGVGLIAAPISPRTSSGDARWLLRPPYPDCDGVVSNISLVSRDFVP